MKLNILIGVACSLSFQMQALEYEPQFENNPISIEKVTLAAHGDASDVSSKFREAANRYMHFINRLSSGEDFDYYAGGRSILSPDCKKIFNGTLLTSSSDELFADLLQVYKTHGSWTIQPADTILSPESNTAVLRLFVDLNIVGKYTEMLIMRFDSNYLISEINIVFNKIENGYNFE